MEHVIPNPRGEFEELRKSADYSKAKALIGWEPRVPASEGHSRSGQALGSSVVARSGAELKITVVGLGYVGTVAAAPDSRMAAMRSWESTSTGIGSMRSARAVCRCTSRAWSRRWRPAWEAGRCGSGIGTTLPKIRGMSRSSRRARLPHMAARPDLQQVRGRRRLGQVARFR